ncbi:MAG: hypothetical protein BGP16_08620 [Sphingobium sp. 66-54]|nr:MAG: hypothetical protein BGP16_08620 [Sphingobium sp. 66-54]
MMKYPVYAAATVALLMAGTTLRAQAPETAAPADTQAAPPAASAPATAAQSFSDEDLKAFARAAIAASKIQQDTTVTDAEKQPKMLAAVQAEGLDPVKFNSIAQASQADPDLHKRIQTLANEDAATRQSAAAPAPGATTANP